jgi:hypothetical protein
MKSDSLMSLPVRSILLVKVIFLKQGSLANLNYSVKERASEKLMNHSLKARWSGGALASIHWISSLRAYGLTSKRNVGTRGLRLIRY